MTMMHRLMTKLQVILAVCFVCAPGPGSVVRAAHGTPGEPAGAPGKGALPGSDSVAVFHFRAGEDDFYAAFGNAGRLESLGLLLRQHHDRIASGLMPVRVDGYCTSATDARESFETAVVRSNRVKSQLIHSEGMREAYFITKNHVALWEGLRDVVVVRVPVPVPDPEPAGTPPAPRPEPEPLPQSAPLPEPEPEQAPARAPQPDPAPVARHAQRCVIDIRTNLLYDAFLVPTLGVEWHAAPRLGIRLDGSFSYWGEETGDLQKLWLVSPGVRFYTGTKKRFYFGLGGNCGRYNIYGGLIGGFFPDKTGYGGFTCPVGYQGSLWNAGLTLGWQPRLAQALYLDLNLGLGYTRLEYDSFNLIGGVRVYNLKGAADKFWGPTQAGVSLMWRIGEGK